MLDIDAPASPGMGVSPVKHGQDVRATVDNKRFCKSLHFDRFVREWS